jgi:hypothetical protein
MPTTPIKVLVTAPTATNGEKAVNDDKESSSSSSSSSPAFNLPDWDAAVYEELEQELGWLEEEDMEAAVATLLDNHPRKKMDDEHHHTLNASDSINSLSTLPIPLPSIITNNNNNNEPPSISEQAQATAAVGATTTTTKPSGHYTQPGITTETTTVTTTPASASSKPHSTRFTPSEILPHSKQQHTPTVATRRGGGGAVVAAAASRNNNMAMTTVTNAQHDELKGLMHKHYQLLMQQAVLAVRAAHYHKYNRNRMDRLDRTDFITGGETADDMVEILDAACGMLQDLDQNRKDSIRHFMQFHHRQATTNKTKHKKRNQHNVSTTPTTMTSKAYAASQAGAQRSLFIDEENSDAGAAAADDDDDNEDDMIALGESQQAERRLTRAQFNKSLQEQHQGRQSESVFDIQGLCNLGETFATIDQCVVESDKSEAAVVPAVKQKRLQTMEIIQQGLDGKSTAPEEVDETMKTRLEKREEHLLETDSTEKACLMVLEKANVKYDKRLIPGARDVSDNFVDPQEFLGPAFKPPCSKEEELLFRRNRNLFTSGEDNLVLRGVNLFGEKQWLLIADRFIPDRSIK